MSGQEPQPDQNADDRAESTKGDNARAVYEYAQKAYDSVSEAQTYMVGHAYKLILVQAALFAALASGQTTLQASIRGIGEYRWALWPIELIGALGAVAGACAFWHALHFVFLQRVAIPESRHLIKQAKGSGLDAMEHAEVVKALTRATARATQANLENEPKRASQSESLDRCLRKAFILTVVFVAACQVCRLPAVLSPEKGGSCGVVKKKEDLKMDQENQRKETRADQPAEPPAEQSAGQSADQSGEQEQGDLPEVRPSADVLDAEPVWITRAKTDRLHTKKPKDD